MNVNELLAELSQRNVKLSVDSDSGQLNIRAPKGVLTKELRDSLTESKAEILAFLQTAKTSATPQLVPIERSHSLPLSWTQERLWFLDRLLSDNSCHNLPIAFRIKGLLNQKVMTEAIAEIIRRHEILRTAFIEKDGEPVPVISSDLGWQLPIIDLQTMPPEAREAQAQKIAQEAAQHQFNLSEAPLWSAKLLCLAPDDHVFVLSMHHIVSDGWSLSVFLRELSAIYDAFAAGKPSPLPELPVQYVDFAAWQRRSFTDELLNPQLDCWQELLDGDLVPLQLPTDRPQSASQSYHGEHYEFSFSGNLSQEIKSFAAKEGITLYVMLLAGWQTLFHLYTGQEDLIICSPIAGRNQPETEGAIGYFNNILPMRTKIAGELTFRELLGQIRQFTNVAYANQDVPFQKLATLPNVMRTPLSRALLALQPPPSEALKLAGLAIAPLHIYRGTIDFDLPLFMEDTGENLAGVLYYKTDLFDASTISEIVANFQDLMGKLVANPEQKISDLLKLGSDRAFSTLADVEKPKFFAPRDEIELKLAKIWEKALNIKPIGIRDHFFNNLGGSSLIAVSLFAQIEKAFQRNLPLAVLIQAPTIEQLAGILRQEGLSNSWSSLVPIQPLGSKPPIFFIHAKGGNILTYVDISRYLGVDQPVYGLQAQGIDGRGSFHNSIEEMASHYLKEILSLQPEGPYFLGGLSGGGVIAFEMAQRLIAQGQKVAFLALFDTYNPEYGQMRALADKKYRQQQVGNVNGILHKSKWYRHQVQNLKQFFRIIKHLLQLKGQEKVSFLTEKVDKLKNKIENQLDVIAYKLNPRRNAPLPYPIREAAINQVIVRSVRSYISKPYAGKITLFRANASIYTSSEGLDNDEVGWTKVAGGGLEIHKVPGEHNTLLAEPHVRTLAPILINCLDEAQKLDG
ncbi:condensation domain-containing protein [Merismopedia glauca]|uniref:Carrier domain-containing protein n=1 Tax=Merismopedia glauca CCAP 1448/3 TaxID=1296344 RepID=A0A2T1BZA5_9CYAN|nr:condensation domain-containing protein [Merismopedia glauca]PSB01284.1 hypothetical protein C7B64_19125 [Merismopedia glauca CCAP 1448/3]